MTPGEAAAGLAVPIRALVGVSGWKRQTLPRFFDDEVRFFDQAAAAVEHARATGGAVGVWATREPPELAAVAEAAAVPVARIEDGFIRSIGLGSDLIPGASIVVDRRGIYYDPTRPSDLEVLLNEARFDPGLVRRAAELRVAVVRHGLTKYNLATGGPERRDRSGRWILVPGQVEDDQSVRLGGAGVAGNLDLLARVRAAEPDAHILFKPHPDVEAGHRPGRISPEAALAYADQVIPGTSMAAVLGVVDEVHTLTSLAGFEALLRGLKVTTYGQPFYAGWGLTREMAPGLLRRRRKLALDELAAGALILYPRYLDPVSLDRCEPEALIGRLAERRFWRGGPLVAARKLQGSVIRALRGFGIDLRRGR